ncbi:MAG: MBL fold metallo-hydrolase, partial [Syntrophorhabdaceae bacterium]|nr:MBL fold metallo-hydrolase [Syntrophorhabdaceae bacterium]
GNHITPPPPPGAPRHDVPIHLHRENLDGFAQKVLPRTPARAPIQPFSDGKTFSIGNISVRPFRVPHDACGVTCGFSFTSADGKRNTRVTMATDLGHNGNGLFEEFLDSDLILIEANYDENMLNLSRRTDKSRVRSDRGHLSNFQAGKLLARIFQESSKPPSAVILCHLSRDHNTPELARNTVREILSAHRFDGIPIHAARRDTAIRKFSV